MAPADYFLYIIDDKSTGAYLTEATSEILRHHGVEDGVEAGVRVGHHVGHHLVHAQHTLQYHRKQKRLPDLLLSSIGDPDPNPDPPGSTCFWASWIRIRSH